MTSAQQTVRWHRVEEVTYVRLSDVLELLMLAEEEKLSVGPGEIAKQLSVLLEDDRT